MSLGGGRRNRVGPWFGAGAGILRFPALTDGLGVTRRSLLSVHSVCQVFTMLTAARRLGFLPPQQLKKLRLGPGDSPTATQLASGQARSGPRPGWPHRLHGARLPWRGLPFSGQTGLGAVVATPWAFGAGAGGGGNPHCFRVTQRAWGPEGGPGFSGSQAEATGYVSAADTFLLPPRGSAPISLSLPLSQPFSPSPKTSILTAPPTSSAMFVPPGIRPPLGSWSHPSRPSRAPAMRAGVLCSWEGRGSESFAPLPVSCAPLPGACRPPSELPRSGRGSRPGPPHGSGFRRGWLFSPPQAELSPQARPPSGFTWPPRLLPVRPATLPPL